MTTTEENNKNNEKKARPGLKLLLIAGMCVAFLIPQLLLKNLVSERKSTESIAGSLKNGLGRKPSQGH